MPSEVPRSLFQKINRERISAPMLEPGLVANVVAGAFPGISVKRWRVVPPNDFRKQNIGGGETGIRTLEGCYTLLVFKTSAFNRSAISPKALSAYNLDELRLLSQKSTR